MTLELWITAAIILVLIGLSFLFSGTETGMTASSKARLHALQPTATSGPAPWNG